MRLPWTKSDTERQYRATYTDEVMAADWAGVTGGGNWKADEAGRVAYGIRLFESAFAVADVSPAIPALTPELLASIARRLILRGNALYAIDVDRNGLQLLPVHTWDIGGLASPWLGVSPLAAAGLSSRMITYLETRLGDEVSTRAGYIVPHPDGVAAQTVTNLRKRLATMIGGNGLIEAGAGGSANAMRPMTKPWEPVRLGADIPEYNVELRRDVVSDCLAALGINPQLADGDGSAIRESFRQLALVVDGMAAQVSAELSAKLEQPISMTFRRVGAIDFAAKARATAAYAGIEGVDVDRALSLAGVQE